MIEVGLAWDRSSLNCDVFKIALRPPYVTTELVISVTKCKPYVSWYNHLFAKLKPSLRDLKFLPIGGCGAGGRLVFAGIGHT